jgi:hypothetical protein
MSWLRGRTGVTEEVFERIMDRGEELKNSSSVWTVEGRDLRVGKRKMLRDC